MMIAQTQKVLYGMKPGNQHSQTQGNLKMSTKHEGPEKDTAGASPTVPRTPPRQKIPSVETSRHKEVQQNERLMCNRWKLGRTLGKGGFGYVKEGFDMKTRVKYALKIITKRMEPESRAPGIKETDEERRKRLKFNRQMKQVQVEIEILRSIDHPNVLRLVAHHMNAPYPHRDGTVSNTVLMVLEYAPNGSLFDLMFYTKFNDEVLGRTYCRQIAEGIRALHLAGVAHRDLKPENVLLGRDFQVLIADFGLSSLNGDLIMATSGVGTRGYRAPEMVLKRKRYTNKVDVFSYGVLAFLILFGYPPFTKAAASDPIFKKIAKGNYNEFWRKHAKWGKLLGGDCRDFLNHCLAYQPKERYDIQEVVEHGWINRQIYDKRELKKVMWLKFKAAQERRRTNGPPQGVATSGVLKPVEVERSGAGLGAMPFLRPFEQPSPFLNVFLKEGVDPVHFRDYCKGVFLTVKASYVDGTEPWELVAKVCTMTKGEENAVRFTFRVRFRAMQCGRTLAMFRFDRGFTAGASMFYETFCAHIDHLVTPVLKPINESESELTGRNVAADFAGFEDLDFYTTA